MEREEVGVLGCSELAVAENLTSVCHRISTAYDKVSGSGEEDTDGPRSRPRLVAVSKTKPVELILRAYQEGQRHFGENYVQALVEKAQDPRLSCLDDLKWHFIGHLQRNKCNSLTQCPHLWMVETVDSERLADSLNSSVGRRNGDDKLNMFVQVNTSGEEEKSGCVPGETPLLVKHIIDKCSHLNFCGLMTIGKSGHDYSIGPNPDFECLLEVKKLLCEELHLRASDVELSMGMSADFEEAIVAGSTNVRVGSIIFGAREPKVAKQ